MFKVLRKSCSLHGASWLMVIGCAFTSPGMAEEPTATQKTHPIVSGFERFFASSKSGVASGGRLLLGELNCLSCHRPQDEKSPVIAPRQAPILDGVAGRVRLSFLRNLSA